MATADEVLALLDECAQGYSFPRFAMVLQAGAVKLHQPNE